MIRDVCFVSSTILYNNIGQETEYLSTYENEWSGSVFRLFCTIAENSYNINVYEMTHNFIKDYLCTDEWSICKLFNNVSPISLIDLQLKEYKIGESVYGDLDLCGWCIMKY